MVTETADPAQETAVAEPAPTEAPPTEGPDLSRGLPTEETPELTLEATPDAPGSEGAETEAAPTTPVLELADLDAAEALVEDNATLKEFVHNRINAEAQRAKNDAEVALRKEAGTREATKQRAEVLFKAAGADPATVDANYKGDLGVIWDLAAANSTSAVLNTMTANILTHYEVSPEVQEGVNALATGQAQIDKMEDLQQWTSAIVDSAVNARVAKREGELVAEIDKRVAKRVQDELRAKEDELMPKNASPPATPRGGETSASAGTVTKDEYANATREQREKWNAGGVELKLDEKDIA
jgi:hypothetical protein